MGDGEGATGGAPGSDRRAPAVEATETVVRLADGATRERALVLGSLPPHGRDLDLLVTEADARRIASALRDAGLVDAGASWVLIRGCAVVAVELVPASSMALAGPELEALFEEAVPVAGAARLVEPAPHHALLILARRLERQPAIEPKHRERIARALAADAHAWSRARERAPAWAAVSALRLLQSRYERAGPNRRRLLPPRPRWTRSFAISGPDGAAVELHAQALHEALERLGYRSALVPGSPEGPAEGIARRPVLRTLAGARELWAAHLKHLGRADVVVYAGHALESAVAAGRGRPPAVTARAARLLRWTTPRPRRVYLLDRAPDDGGASPYRAAAEAIGARPLDSRAPTDTVCELVARDAWAALGRRGHLERAVLRATAASRRIAAIIRARGARR